MPRSRKAQPDGYHAVTPYLIIQGAAAAIDFYEHAFAATEILRMPCRSPMDASDTRS
jgi:PhnB protein